MFNTNKPVITNEIEPWRKDSLYNLDINTILDDIEKCDKILSEMDAAIDLLDETQKRFLS